LLLVLLCDIGQVFIPLAQKAIDEGIELMLKTAFRLLGKQAKTSPGQLRLCGT
jgi:hypothetical protein